MRKRILVSIFMLTALLVAAGSVSAQQAKPTEYTFVAEWQIPRAQWATFTADFEKNTRPILEKLSADGTLVGWGAAETIVHTPEGTTHGTWWTSTTIAGIEKARGELIKSSAASSSLAAATLHRDYYLSTILWNGKAASGTDGYLSVAIYQVKPGQGGEWRRLWEKFTKPIYEDLLAKGLITGYAVEVEDVHTENPALRFVSALAVNLEAEDKIVAAFEAANAKRSPEEQQAIGAAFAAVLEAGTHRDAYMKVIRYWQK